MLHATLLSVLLRCTPTYTCHVCHNGANHDALAAAALRLHLPCCCLGLIPRGVLRQLNCMKVGLLRFLQEG